MTLETTADIARLLGTAQSDSELKALVLEVTKEGRRAYGDDFTIRFDETNMSKNFRNRISIYIPT